MTKGNPRKVAELEKGEAEKGREERRSTKKNNTKTTPNSSKPGGRSHGVPRATTTEEPPANDIRNDGAIKPYGKP